jgi:hypothetical protein
MPELVFLWGVEPHEKLLPDFSIVGQNCSGIVELVGSRYQQGILVVRTPQMILKLSQWVPCYEWTTGDGYKNFPTSVNNAK